MVWRVEPSVMIDINELKYDEKGLIPAIVVDADSGAVLMLAYMNAESLKISMDEGRTCFWSRSRGELWRKGETSGNVQHISSIQADCDKDALTVYVKKDGPACHTGAETCFYEKVFKQDQGAVSLLRDAGQEDDLPAFSLEALYSIIEDRKINGKAGSYTTYLFEKGIDKILKKLGEESTEVIIAGKAGDKAETIYEIADLTYHAMVLMAEMGITTGEVMKELASRHVVDVKVKQEKMT
jgi:phosphoribosyl-ATP pyrophosphohydrolase/phosphoribosyl-AMP cyclohydrolase